MTQLTDRELLEGAAKVGGYEWDDYCEKLGLCYYPNKSRPECASWNPLTNDSDALRLAVKLHIDIRHFMYRDNRMDCLVDRLGKGFAEVVDPKDPYAATRRAITRAAYEIWKEMK